jgi:iron complex transport system substrate-binding protein
LLARTGARSETRKARRQPRPPLLFALPFALFAVAACGEPGPRADTSVRGDSTVHATDDVGRTVELPHPARRVVSLLPAATETLAELGAADRVVGRTRYDTEAWIADLPSVGGGLDPNLEAIIALRPDLVVAWESPTGSRVRDRLESLGIAVYAAATRDTAAIYRTIQGLGALLGRAGAADSLAGHIRAQLDSVRASVPPGPRPSVLYVVAADPPMIAGTDNFISELIEVAGGAPVQISGDRKGLSPQVSLEELVRRQPEVVILPVGEDPAVDLERLRGEPGWRDLAAIREGRAAEVPALLVNRPGPSIGEMAKVLREVLRTHPVPP